MLRSLALLTITGYQRWLSPRKGFSCAYRIHTGGKSCSELGYRGIRRFGLVKGMKILHRRFQRCKAVYRSHHSIPVFVKSQQGVCDAGCDLPCDLPDIHLPHSIDYCDCCDCCDGSDWRNHRRQKRKRQPKGSTKRHSHIS